MSAQLRPSTAYLLLRLAGVRAGHTVLDPMGGSGTVALEAAAQYERVRALSTDRDRAAASAAIRNFKLARPALAPGSSVEARDADARDLRALLEDGCVDRIVTDMPFGHRCRWDAEAELPQLVAEMARLLRPRGGRAVLLMKGCRRLEVLLGSGGEEEAAAAAAGRPRLVLAGKRRVAVGGFSCYALTLEPQPASVSVSE